MVGWRVVVVTGVVVSGSGGQGQVEMSGLVGPEVQPAQLGSKVIIISPPTSNLGASLLLLLTAVVQHVAGSTEVSEPLTAGLS